MRQEVKDQLLTKYNQIKYKDKTTCIKYYYTFNGVNVNVFFDAYDISSLSLCLILSYGKKYYYTSLNIDDTSIRAEFLRKIPKDILNQILVGNHLTAFYERIEEYILSEEPYVNKYSEDIFFVNTMKYSKGDIDYPFWHCLRRVKMHDDTVNRLNASAHVPIKVLKEIQAKNFTLVRTDKPEQRKELTIILDEIGIKLE